MQQGEELYRLIKNTRQEVLNLKQVKRANVASTYNIYEYTPSEYANTFRVTYEPGEQPIISTVLSTANAFLTNPAGNEQYLFAFSQVISKITILSTRPIASVEIVI